MITHFFGSSERQIAITADVQDYNLFTAAGSPTGAVNIRLMIESGVIVSASSPTNAAIYGSSNFPAGSTVHLINKGIISGAGGAGGSASKTVVNPGQDGGHAIQLLADTTINNIEGHIFGGGGGGGSCFFDGSFKWNDRFYTQDYTYSGGGGAGIVAGTGGNIIGTSYYGENGTATQGGRSFTHSYDITYSEYDSRWGGGDLGQPGTVRKTRTDGQPITYADGGAAGAAIDKNSHILTANGGFNAEQIKGAY
jgi:hypothetical protein